MSGFDPGRGGRDGRDEGGYEPQPAEGAPNNPAPDQPARPKPGLGEPPEPSQGSETEIVLIWQWFTAEDDRVDEECAAHDGQRWEGDDGPWPPVHYG